MTNEELQEIMNNPNGISTNDIDRIWADMKARDEQQAAEWDALPDEEKERIFLEFTSDPANERISGYRMERHRGADGKWVYETISELDDEEEPRTDENGVMHF